MDKREIYDLRQQIDGEDPFAAMARIRVDTYNQSQGEDDGTGIQCGECKNRGFAAFLNEDGHFV